LQLTSVNDGITALTSDVCKAAKAAEDRILKRECPALFIPTFTELGQSIHIVKDELSVLHINHPAMKTYGAMEGSSSLDLGTK
jgi:hypothetical protein